MGQCCAFCVPQLACHRQGCVCLRSRRCMCQSGRCAHNNAHPVIRAHDTQICPTGAAGTPTGILIPKGAKEYFWGSCRAVLCNASWWLWLVLPAAATGSLLNAGMYSFLSIQFFEGSNPCPRTHLPPADTKMCPCACPCAGVQKCLFRTA
jgi:hypothetical protein